MSEEPETPAEAPAAAAAGDTPPDRVSASPRSPFYAPDLLERGIGIMFNGTERTNVDEYCVSEGWVKVVAGTARDRKGYPLTIKLQGEVKPFFKS
ncbi:glutathione peroxidase [Polymorphobacter multimanifer]|uniref:DUF3297 family protein n=1 Tax=Polymorphobacter multimanifer TaxID=1070431 RepID=A0A841L5P2_9SPHN|nr:DUF3297 family protein [Polymorphobacter multimanifer]MBB6228229.1 hypothetical protein [Polymorphobacter multimanifer]GGI85761.1 glutathione peroxidase [Polymorphobacter multimanifer]